VATNRMNVMVAAVSLCLLGACATPEPEAVDRRACERLRKRVVDLRLGSVASNLPQGDYDAHHAALTSALGEQYVEACLNRVNAAQIRCTEAAVDESSVTQCLNAGSK
jgi:predicted component of type VI protein secretion system